MVYNPNPPFNPSDYGTHGRIDYDRLEKSKQDVRDTIADLGNNPVTSTAQASVAELLARQPGDHSVATGSYRGDRDSYRVNNYEIPESIQTSMDQNQQFVNTYRQSLQGVPDEYMPEAPIDISKPEKDKNKNIADEIEALKLPNLDKNKKVTETTEGGLTGDLASWDGRDFDYFLQRAQSVKANIDPDDDEGGTTTFGSIAELSPEQRVGNEYTYNDPFKADIYNQLSSAGLSEQDMQDAAQSLGIKNVGGDGTQQEIQDMIKAFQEGNIGSEPVTTTTKVNVGMDNAQNAFGNKFSMSDYNAALGYKNQDAEYISNYLKDYMERGGKVGGQVQALIKPNSTQTQTPATTVYPGFESLLNQPLVGPTRGPLSSGYVF
tara:strand:- start:394 stop:1524 length:1131 start_codon:yes stop_codon:yes gene_type:complete